MKAIIIMHNKLEFTSFLESLEQKDLGNHGFSSEFVNKQGNPQETRNFLNALRALQVTAEDLKMADNFFTILSNRVPEIWFDQGFELGGGVSFTVGPEGDERNKNYTVGSLLVSLSSDSELMLCMILPQVAQSCAVFRVLSSLRSRLM